MIKTVKYISRGVVSRGLKLPSENDSKPDQARTSPSSQIEPDQKQEHFFALLDDTFRFRHCLILFLSFDVASTATSDLYQNISMTEPADGDTLSHWCSCTAYCKGGKLVSKRTFDRHAPDRLTRQFVPLGAFEGTVSVTGKRPAPQNDAGAGSSQKQKKKSHRPAEVKLHFFFPPAHCLIVFFFPLYTTRPQNTSNHDDQNSPDPDFLISGNSPREPSPPRPAEQAPPTPLPPLLPLPRGPPKIVLDNLKIDQAYIDLLKNASLDDSALDADTLHRLRNPIEEVLDVDADPDLLLSIENFLSLTNASDKAYTDVRANIMRRFPDCAMLSHHLVKQKITELTGVISIVNDMCVNSCVAFTGPRVDADACSECGESRWDPQRLADSGGVTKIS
jgi:hypothetical protein